MTLNINFMKPTDLIKQEEIISVEKQASAIRPSVYIRTLNVITTPFKRRYEKHYKISKKHLIIDLIFVILILLLIIINAYLLTQKFFMPEFSITFRQKQAPVQQEKTNFSLEKIFPKLSLKTEALYFNVEGDQLGLGAWPPKINALTNLAINVKIKAESGSWKKTKFQAKLPNNITWAKNSSINKGSAIVYEISKNMIIWNIDTLDFEEEAEAVFNLEFMPSDEYLNKKILLLESVSAIGLNQETEREFEVSVKNLYSPIVQY